MIEKKALMFEELLSTAKTIRQRLAHRCCENWNSGSPCDKECDEPLVSLGLVLQLREQLRQKALEIDKPSNDYAEVCKQNRQYRSLLREVLGKDLWCELFDGEFRAFEAVFSEGFSQKSSAGSGEKKEDKP